ncbi:hypothetical protein [Amycolatopsis sp. SID8362]|uniref:COG1470 family protein n=1 Tax=Amycolatopsis sp. SID8362 TaxID=2690346 RepID=UPI001371ED81|nr:hypothetical protein [Amycolatopsis sp. SID8362]NBH06065.1 hypothetical protein [Amycolatopsis sp. SID8362]NED42764.1 hypothetical protein [Amycolatopsis sp. SID8362]
MAVSVVVSATATSASPGRDTHCRVRVRNTGPVVDQFGIVVIGEPAGWTRVEPSSVNLLPDTEQLVDLVFTPPRSPEVPAGEVPFAVQVISREDPEGSVVEEGTVTVEPFTSLVTELVPRSSRGRRAGEHTAVVDNLGNQPLWLNVLAADPDDKLDIRITPDAVIAEPGTATFVKLKVRPKKTFLKGNDQTLAFQATVLPEGEDPIPLNGIMVQRQLLPRGLLLALAMLVGLLLAAVVMLNTVLASTPISTARSALPSTPSSAPPVSLLTSSSAPSSVPSSGVPGSDGQSVPNSSGGVPGSSGAQPTSGGQGGTTVTRTIRVLTSARPTSGGDPQLFSYPVPSGTTLTAATVRLQNPARDTGTIVIRRNGELLLSLALESFSDRTVQPNWVFSGGQDLVVAVTCRNTQVACTPSVTVVGPVTSSG